MFVSVDSHTGVAGPTVNPLKHAQREPLITDSPEGQSFFVTLWAAFRDYVGVHNGWKR